MTQRICNLVSSVFETVASPPPPPIPPTPTIPSPTTPTPSPFTLPTAQILPDNLPAHIHKHLVHIQPPPRARLVIRDIPPHLRDLEGFCARDPPVVFEVCFVSYEDDGDRGVVVLHVRYLFAELAEFGEAGGAGDGEDEEEALGVAHVHFSY